MKILHIPKFRSLALVVASLSIVAILSGCGGASKTMRTKDEAAKAPAKTDPFALLDEQVKAGNIDPNLVEGRVDAARQEWLRALVSQQKNQKVEVVKHFENAIEILDHLINYPGVDTNKEYQDVSNSVISDYEKYVAKIDSLPPNASMFAFREKYNQDLAKQSAKNVPAPRIDLTTTQIPLTMNTSVEQTISYFTQGNGRPFMAKWLARTQRYFPMMKKIMKEEGVPEEMVHLAMIESGLNPNAVSWAKAVGMWQFIDATGSRYGLTNNWWYDKRRDPVTATRAAARHLHDLYRELGDWHLALAAYNSGINRVRSAMAQAGSNNFWEIRPFLPKETQNYVPLYIAATMIALDPAHYGFTDINFETPLKYDTVHVKEAIDLNALAKAAGVTELEVKELNPELLQPSTPPVELCDASGYCLRIPAGTSSNFYDRLAAIPQSERRPWLVHTVTKGESLKSIAHEYGIPTSQLAEYNDKTTGERVRRGEKLRVPMTVMAPQSGNSEDEHPAPKATPATESNSGKSQATGGTMRMISYKVHKGETMYSIASKHGVSVAEIKQWNHMGRKAHLKKGQTIKLMQPAHKSVVSEERVAEAKAEGKSAKKSQITLRGVKGDRKKAMTYRVKQGDTLFSIAGKYDVAVSDLKRANRLRGSSIAAGSTLTIPN